MMELEELAFALSKHQVKYLLCGGFAVSLYAVPRITADMDILLDLTEDNIQRFLSAMQDMQYTNALPLQLEVLVHEPTRLKFIKERNLIAYSFYSTLSGKMSLDVMLDVPAPFGELWNRRETRKSSAGYTIQLIGRDDLIKMKEYAGRDRDKADIILLSRAKNFQQNGGNDNSGI